MFEKSGWTFMLVPAGGTFGSGRHESTRECLRVIADWSPAEDSVVCDVGCGTGVLALAAAERGFRRIVACDIEGPAVIMCRRNVSDNHRERVISIVQSSAGALSPGVFSHVIANIQGDILLSLGDDLCRLVRPGGRLLLAGIAWEWLFEVKRMIIQRGFTISNARMGDEFATLVSQARAGGPNSP